MTTPIFGLSSAQMVFYEQDLEEASRRGTVPSRKEFRRALGLDLMLRIRVDYDLSVQLMLRSNLFPRFVGVQIEGADGFLEDPPRSAGRQAGTRMVNFGLLDPGLPTTLLEIGDSLQGTERRVATFVEALHFLHRNSTVWRRFPIVALQDSGKDYMAVFFGSLSGGDARVIRLRSTDTKWRGCRYLIVTL